MMSGRSIEETELAKDFGFDVTAPNGGLQTSAANHRLYKTECRKIYSDFLLNMREYLFQEEQMKQELIKMRVQSGSPNKRNMGKNSSLSSRSVSSRRVSVHMDCRDGMRHDDFKPKYGKINLNKPRPRTVIGTQRKSGVSNEPNDDTTFPKIKTESGASITPLLKRRTSQATIVSTKSTQSLQTVEKHNAIWESNSDFACNRVIKMNPIAFSKLVCGKAYVRVLNKSNGYLLKPVSEEKTSILMPKDVGRSSVPERLALIRETTNFKSPTLSNDLKVNNLVAIKKSLVAGETSPRLTVGDVMLSARERRSRLFRIQLIPDHIDGNISPRIPANKSNGFSGAKTPSPKTASPRLTRQNLAKFEQESQKRAFEQMRKTVVSMAAALGNKDQDQEACENVPILKKSHRRVSIAQYQVENKEKNTLDDVDTRSTLDPRDKYNQVLCDGLQPYSNPKAVNASDGHNAVKRSSISSKLHLHDGCSPRLRSELSVCPVTVQSWLCPQKSSHRKLTHQDTMAFLKRCHEDDRARDLEMNRWRQRMIFASSSK